jgi:hypothetical protein
MAKRIVLATLLLLNLGVSVANAADQGTPIEHRASGRKELAVTCRKPGDTIIRPDLPRCTLQGLPEAFGDEQRDPAPDPSPRVPPIIPILCDDGCYPHPEKSNQGDDPDMGGRGGVPPNSVGSGTR